MEEFISTTQRYRRFRYSRSPRFHVKILCQMFAKMPYGLQVNFLCSLESHEHNYPITNVVRVKTPSMVALSSIDNRGLAKVTLTTLEGSSNITLKPTEPCYTQSLSNIAHHHSNLASVPSVVSYVRSVIAKTVVDCDHSVLGQCRHSV